MKFKIINRLKTIRSANDIKDLREIKEELVRLNNAHNELTEMLEKVLSNIDNDNISPDVLNKVGQRPVGSVTLRYLEQDNAGYDYGTWQLMEDTITTAKTFLFIYIRTS